MASDTIDQTIVGRYRILDMLGRGGMGIVYKVYDTRLKRLAALKVLRADLMEDPDYRVRFLSEAKIGTGLVHPNLVRMYDYGRTDGELFIVIEYIDGRSLGQVLAEGRALDESYAAEIICQVGYALGYIHERGIIHRDVKPSNILISSDGRVLLSDLGLAEGASESSLTSGGMIFGSPTHMAPERLRGERADERTDIYSLGVVLYQLLTDRLPFIADSPEEVRRKVITQAPPSPRAINPSISIPLEEVVLKALAKEPRMRYQDVREFVADLDRAASSQVSASPASAFSVSEALSPVSPQQTSVAPRSMALPARLSWLIWIATLTGVVCIVGLLAFVAASGWVWMREHPFLAAILLIGGFLVPVAIWIVMRYFRVPTCPTIKAHKPAARRGSRSRRIEAVTGRMAPYSPLPCAATRVIREPSAMAWLLVLNGANRGRQFRLSDAMVLGRAPTCDIVLPDVAISRQHALVKLIDERFYIYDRGSRNGIFINGLRIVKPTPMQDRDEIHVGGTTMLFIQAVSPKDLNTEAKRRLDQFDAIWKGLTQSVRHD